MPEFYKPSMFGGKQRCIKEDANMSEVVFAAAEFFAYEDQIGKLYRDLTLANNAKDKAEKALRDALEAGKEVVQQNDQLVRRIEQMEHEAESKRGLNAEEIRRCKERLMTLEAQEADFRNMRRSFENLRVQLTHAEDANRNLKRIARERANGDRGLEPKATRSGYVIQNSKEYADTWVTRFQTPYVADFPSEHVRAEVELALHKVILPEVGLSRYEDYSLTRDFRGGYWLIDLTHKDELGTIDADLIPAKNKGSRRK